MLKKLDKINDKIDNALESIFCDYFPITFIIMIVAVIAFMLYFCE